MPICLRLLTHCARRAASRADCTAGSKSAIKTEMMEMTTSNSIRVKPRRMAFGIISLPFPEQDVVGGHRTDRNGWSGALNLDSVIAKDAPQGRSAPWGW